MRPLCRHFLFMPMPRRPSALPPTSSVFLRLPQQYATGVADKQIIPHEVPKCNRKLYSPVLSCTHHGKIPAAKSGFVCFADKIGLVFSFLVFYLFGYLFVQAFPVQVKPVRAKPAQEKPFLGKKAPKAGNLGRYLAGQALCRCGANAPKQGRFSR